MLALLVTAPPEALVDVELPVLLLPKLLPIAPPTPVEPMLPCVSVPAVVPTTASDVAVFPVVVGSVAVVLSEASPEFPQPVPNSSPTSNSRNVRSMLESAPIVVARLPWAFPPGRGQERPPGTENFHAIAARRKHCDRLAEHPRHAKT